MRHGNDFKIWSEPHRKYHSLKDSSSIPGLGRSPGEGKGYPLQYSGLENSMDCIVHGVTKRHDWATSTSSKTPYFTKVLELLSKPAVYQWLEFIAHLAGGSCCPTIYFTDTGLLKTLRLKDDKWCAPGHRADQRAVWSPAPALNCTSIILLKMDQ